MREKSSDTSQLAYSCLYHLHLLGFVYMARRAWRPRPTGSSRLGCWAPRSAQVHMCDMDTLLCLLAELTSGACVDVGPAGFFFLSLCHRVGSQC